MRAFALVVVQERKPQSLPAFVIMLGVVLAIAVTCAWLVSLSAI